MTIHVLFIQRFKITIFFVDFSILPSSCCLFTLIYYVTIPEYRAVAPLETTFRGKRCALVYSQPFLKSIRFIISYGMVSASGEFGRCFCICSERLRNTMENHVEVNRPLYGEN